MSYNVTATDLFAGAGGSSTGMVNIPGLHVRIAANHWKLAIAGWRHVPVEALTGEAA